MFIVVLIAIAVGAAPSSLADASGAISGTVTEAAAPYGPIVGIEVCAYALGSEEDESEEETPCVITGAGGEYLLTGLSSGEYTVVFFAPLQSQLNYIPQFYDERASASAAQAVSVNVPKTTTGIDAQLVVGGVISGTITDAKTGAAIEAALICASLQGSDGVVELAGCGRSEASGAYKVTGLASGEYEVFFFHSGYQPQYYDGKTKESEASLVAVTQGATTAGIDAALQPGSALVPVPPGLEGAPPGASKGVPPVAAMPVATVSSHRFALRHRSVAVKVACAHARCVGRIGLRRIDKGQLMKEIAFGSFSIAPDHTRTVTIHLLGRKLSPTLAHARRHPVRLELELSVRGGNSVEQRVLVN